jgi:hypothetical protein
LREGRISDSLDEEAVGDWIDIYLGRKGLEGREGWGKKGKSQQSAVNSWQSTVRREDGCGMDYYL